MHNTWNEAEQAYVLRGGSLDHARLIVGISILLLARWLRAFAFWVAPRLLVVQVKGDELTRIAQTFGFDRELDTSLRNRVLRYIQGDPS